MTKPVKRFFYDLETTGVDHTIHAIHQFAYVLDVDGETVETGNVYMRPFPGSVGNPKALEICGVTPDELKAYPSADEGFRTLRHLFDKYINKFDKTDKMFLAGYNITAFDNLFFKAFWQRYDDYFFSYFWSSGLDVMVLALENLIRTRCELPDFKLGTVADCYNVVPEGDWHDALTDVQVTRDIYYVITAPAYQRIFNIEGMQSVLSEIKKS